MIGGNFTPSSGLACGSSGKPHAAIVLGRSRGNGDTNHSLSKSDPGSGQPASTRAREKFSDARTIAIEAIAAQSNRGDLELSSPAVWNRYVHHRPVQRDSCGIW